MSCRLPVAMSADCSDQLGGSDGGAQVILAYITGLLLHSTDLVDSFL